MNIKFNNELASVYLFICLFDMYYWLFIHLFIYAIIYFLSPRVLNPWGLKYKEKNKIKHDIWKGYGADSEIGNVSARQAALNRWTATNKRWKRKSGFSRVSRYLSQTTYDLRQALSWALTLVESLRVSRDNGKSRGSGRASSLNVVCLPNSCSLCRTGPDDGTLLEVGTTQGVNHCPVPCGSASSVLRQQCQTIRVLAVLTNQTAWFLYVIYSFVCLFLCISGNTDAAFRRRWSGWRGGRRTTHRLVIRYWRKLVGVNGAWRCWDRLFNYTCSVWCSNCINTLY